MSQLNGVAAAMLKEQRGRVEERGDQLMFYVKALAWAPRAIRRYPREIKNTLAEITFGAGGLSLIGGTVGVIAFLAFFAGTEVGIQGYASLSQIGVAKFAATNPITRRGPSSATPYRDWIVSRVITITPAIVITSTNAQRVREVAGGAEHVLEILGKPYDLEAIVKAVESATRGQDSRLPPGATQV